jgi:phosphoglycerate dehydrogenase-like enzyme
VSAPLNILILLEADAAALERLRAAAPQVRVSVGPAFDITGDGGEVPANLLHDVDCVLCEQLPRNFDDFRRLKWVQLSSAGYSQIFGLPLLERGIRVTNARGSFDVPIAEWNVMMLLAWHRNLAGMLDNQRRRVFDRSADFQQEFRGSVVGFYGYGGLARETARLLKTMGITVWALTRDGTIRPRDNMYRVPGTGDPDGRCCDRVFPVAEKTSFLAGLDYLILATPITPASTGVIGEAELRALPPRAVLINPARAGLVQEEALVRCLTEGWIRGASFDVHYAYPLPPEHRVWSLPNLILTPHISGAGLNQHYVERTFDIFIENLARLQSGRPLLNELSPAQIRGE